MMGRVVAKHAKIEKDCVAVCHIIDRFSRKSPEHEFLRRINAHVLRRMHEMAHDRLEEKVAKKGEGKIK